jgi:ParB-like chromosome segregation protein Spo0J
MTEQTPFQFLPALAPDDYRRLRDSIAERGVEVPIVVDEDGNVLDGHHRARIAAELGVYCPRTVRDGMSDAEKRLLAVELNLARRQLTDGQKVLLGRMIEPDVAERARKRQEELGRLHGEDPSAQLRGRGDDRVDNRPQGEADHVGAIAPQIAPEPSGQAAGEPERGETRDLVAKAVGLGSGDTYARAKKTIEAAEQVAPDLIPKVEAGEVDLPEVRREIRRRAPASPLARAFLQAGEEAVANAAPESLDAFREMVVESQELPVTAEHLAKAASLLSRADLELREVRDDLIARLVADPNERERLDRAISLLSSMLGRCRGWAGTKRELRRVG